MFTFAGAGLTKLKHFANEGKRPRHSIDQWDRVCLRIFPRAPLKFANYLPLLQTVGNES